MEANQGDGSCLRMATKCGTYDGLYYVPMLIAGYKRTSGALAMPMHACMVASVCVWGYESRYSAIKNAE